jgi:hypothetical protein
MTEIICSFATVNDKSSTRQRIRRTGTWFEGMQADE